MHDGNSPFERNFFAVTKTAEVRRLLFDVFGVVMTVYMNWRNAIALMLQNIILKIKKIKRVNEQTIKNFFSYVSVSAMSSFDLIKDFQLVKKKSWTNKNGFHVCFQNKANVPITIINCCLCLQLTWNVLSLHGNQFLQLVHLFDHSSSGVFFILATFRCHFKYIYWYRILKKEYNFPLS